MALKSDTRLNFDTPMHLRAGRALGSGARGILTALGSGARGALTVVAAALVGFAIPAFWTRVAAQIQAESAEGSLAFTSIVVLFVGLVATYFFIIWLAGLRAARRVPPGERPPPRRYNWNRSLRDERHKPPSLNPLETVFVTTVVLVGSAYMVWFFVFAKASLPSAP